MAKARFEPNPDGLKDVLRLPAVDGPLRELAERGAGIARGLAPVGSGTYRDSIAAVELDQAAWERPRFRFGSDDEKAHLLEWPHATRGGGAVEGQRVLGRAAEQLGGTSFATAKEARG